VGKSKKKECRKKDEIFHKDWGLRFASKVQQKVHSTYCSSRSGLSLWYNGSRLLLIE
jgi:hypothetical protein